MGYFQLPQFHLFTALVFLHFDTVAISDQVVSSLIDGPQISSKITTLSLVHVGIVFEDLVKLLVNMPSLLDLKLRVELETEGRDEPFYVRAEPPDTPVLFKLRSLEIYLEHEDSFPINWLLGNSQTSLKFLDAYFTNWDYLAELEAALTSVGSSVEALCLLVQPYIGGGGPEEGIIANIIMLCPNLVQFATKLYIEEDGDPATVLTEYTTIEAINASVLFLKHLHFNLIYDDPGSFPTYYSPHLDTLALLIDNHDARTVKLESITFQSTDGGVDSRFEALLTEQEEKLLQACNNRGIVVRMLPHDAHEQ